jgi:small subunit ribosomal protein S8
MFTDSISDCLTRIKNAGTARHQTVAVRGSNAVARILELLKREGFIEFFEKKSEADKPGYTFSVGLKYYQDGNPVISEISRVSKPGRRLYSGVEKLPRVHSGLGMAIISTSQGMMTDSEARKKNVGGELVALVS